jgi:predicted dehydrogenase
MVDCAIIGCGRIAGRYDEPDGDRVRTHAKAFQRHTACRLVGVCDTDASVARRFADTWGVPLAYSDPRTLLDVCRPQILSICTPTDSHEPLLGMACDAAVSRVWLEKPAAGSTAAISRLQAMAAASGTEVWVNYFRRYDAGFLRAKQLLDEIAPIRNVRAIYTKGLRHNGSHMIDLIHWFFGSIEEIVLQEVLPDAEFPAATARLLTSRTPIDLVALDYRDYELFELDVLGAGGRITVKDGGQQIVVEGVIDAKYYHGYRNLATQFVHADTYATFMLAGLDRGLRGDAMPGLADELAIQRVLDRFSQLAGHVF